MKLFKRASLVVSAVALGCIIFALLIPLYHETPPIEPPDVANDVAGLNRTVVREVIHPINEEEIRNAIFQSAASKTKIAIAGKRHSMGGQTLYPDAIALDMLRFNKIVSLDEANKLLVVQSGATWNEIQQFLNPRGLAVLAMQGPNVFTVGGSMSVNAHGWDMRHGPVGASVEWFDIVLDDGSVRRCRRDENSELFHLVLGGYGLFGVILDVGLRVTDNSAYLPTVSEVDFTRLPDYFKKEMDFSPQVELGEADLSIAPGTLLSDAVALVYQRQEGNSKRTDPLQEEQHLFRDRYFFDLSRQYDSGKTLRWALQKRLEYPIDGNVRTRNNIFRSPIGRIRHYSSKDTDILQEYFISPGNFAAFINGLRDIVKGRQINLLNATVRYIEPNNDAFLNYSGQAALAIVLYINIETSPTGLARSSEMTREIINLALRNNGTFYLPYVLDYDKAELLKAYPMANEFFAAKKRYDPSERFSNEFYLKYSN
jgi:decaprenylphospho-beta-D-ribofuranose 2-oxidase